MLLIISRYAGVFLRNTLKPSVLSLTECHSFQTPLTFRYDITPYLKNVGPQELIVRVYDPTDLAGIPRGKQRLHPAGFMYTSCTGIWQPVWLEPVDESGALDLTIAPDVDGSRLRLTVH